VSGKRLVSPRDVERIFRVAAKRGPWLSEGQYQRLAKLINDLPLSRPKFAKSKRTKTPQQMLTDILPPVNSRLGELHRLMSQLGSGAYHYKRDILVIEARNFERLKDAIEGVMPHFAGLEPTQARTYWHRFALELAYHTRAEWLAAGRRSVAANRNSPLGKFVAAIIRHQLGCGPSPATVATLLRRRQF
jgi:hypothetical protein